jgi:type III restriction enzyme
MRLKDYQKTALNRVKKYLSLVRIQLDKGNIRHSSEDAWRDLKIEFNLGRYIEKENGLGQDSPNFVLKIPTGGGKTLLAVKTIDIINEVLHKKRTGLVLWVVPTTSIFRQTVKALKDRNHPYRQHLDLASGGRTLVMEKYQGKIDRFSPNDVEENLVVYVLMLQAAARNELAQKDLRIFSDSVGFADFFPPDDRLDQHEKLLEQFSNLETFNEAGGIWKRQIKTSLGNALRLLNPIVILDESQKAYSETAQRTIRGFNPSIIVELSATPPQGSNVLIDIKGRELNDEEMIKLDMHITNKGSLDWKDTLWASVKRRNELEQAAQKYEQNYGVYIRPICLIRTERVGREQRGRGYIHSDDVRDELIRKGIPSEQIAIKTSEKDELKDVDDIGGLTSRNCSIRYIITKQALQEGWDCAFAYVLAILDKIHSRMALTQMVGRILRQPYAMKTGTRLLDESYVYVYRQEAAVLLDGIKNGFEQEGLGDLRKHISPDEGMGGYKNEYTKKEFKIRKRFETIAKQIILPFFVIRDHNGWRRVNYEIDILSRIPWNRIDLTDIYSLPLAKRKYRDDEFIAYLSDDIKKVIEEKKLPSKESGRIVVDEIFMAQQLNDVVINPWIAYEYSKKILGELTNKYDLRIITQNLLFIIEESKRIVGENLDLLAKKAFLELIKSENIRFVVAGKDFGFKIPSKIPVYSGINILRKQDGTPVQQYLFDFVPSEYFNELERPVAYFLDDQRRLYFWYRNRSRADYGIQAWRKDKIYPDFIFTITEKDKRDSVEKIYIVETKGIHLAGNPDTIYKESVFGLCNDLIKKSKSDALPLTFKEKQIDYEVIYGTEWQRKLSELFIEKE